MFTLDELMFLIQKRMDDLEARKKWLVSPTHDLHIEFDARLLELESFRLDLLLMEELK